MPQLKNNTCIPSLQQMSTFLFLSLMCCSLVFQFAHVHHSHTDETLTFEVSYHSAGLVAEHSSTHHHEGEKPSHSNDRQHSYEKQDDWNISRSPSTKTGTFGEQSLLSSIEYLPPADSEKPIFFHQKPAPIKEHYISLSIIRGPPLFG